MGLKNPRTMIKQKPHFLKEAFAYLERADPGFYSLVLSLQATFAGLMGAGYWLFFRPPASFIILLTPAIMVLMAHQLRIRQDWFWALFLTAVNIAAATFIFSVLYNDRYLILGFLFIYTFLNFFSSEYRAVGSSAVLLGTLSTGLTGGWHNGVNYAILVGMSFVIVVISFVAFSQVYRSCIRAVLQLLMKQVIAAFSGIMETDKSKPMEDEQEIVGSYSNVALKSDFLIRKMVYYLPRTKRFQQKAIPVLISLRRLMADTALIQGMQRENDALIAALPTTSKVTENILYRLRHSRSAFRRRTDPAAHDHEKVYKAWYQERNLFQQNSTSSENLAAERLLYGLDCVLKDLKRLEQAVFQLHQPTFLKPVSNEGQHTTPGIETVPGLQRQPLSDSPEKGRKRFKRPNPHETPNIQLRKVKQGIYQDAFKAAIATTLALFFWKAAHLPHGYWLLMTTSLLFFGGNQGHVLQRAGHRMIGTTLGLILAYLFVADFLSKNIYWAGILPVIFFCMFYLYFLTGNYGIMATFVSIYVAVLLSTLSGSQQLVDFFLFGTLFNRFVCTLLAGFLVVLCITLIFPGANRSADIMERTLASFFEDLSSCVRILANRYILREELSDEEWVMINGMIEKYASTERLHSWMSYEINLDHHYKTVYASSKDEIEALLGAMRPLIALSCHPRVGSLSADQKQSIMMARDAISNALKDVEPMFSGLVVAKEKALYEQIEDLFDGELKKRFFAHKLLKFAEALEQLMRAVLPEQEPAILSRAVPETTRHPS